MKQRLCSLLLALLMLAGAVSPVSAAFQTVKTYQEQFTDVLPDAWYYENVKALYQLGLTNGQGTTDRFAPDANITVAEALTICARLRSLHETGDSEKGPNQFRDRSELWYTPYVSYLKSLHIIDTEFDLLYDTQATRAQVAHILVNALPAELFSDINAKAVAVGYASRSYIKDVNEYTPYQQDILALYRRGILSGMDRTGSFHPDAYIQRSQVAAMVTRLAYSELRIRLNWDLALTHSKEGTTLDSLVHSNGTFHTAPAINDEAAIDDNIRYMLSRGERSMTLSYPTNTLTEDAINQLLHAFLNGMRHYIEQTYNQARGSYYASTGSLTLYFSSSLYDERMIDSYREAIMSAAIQTHDELWSDGTITADMSDYDKALAYYTWLCNHCQYDHRAGDDSISHSAYGAFENRLAVCDGYTAAYNLLLKLEGIDCSVASNSDHIWSVAELDGTLYHIDPTWGDQNQTVSYKYFAMTEADALSRFP